MEICHTKNLPTWKVKFKTRVIENFSVSLNTCTFVYCIDIIEWKFTSIWTTIML